MRDEAAVIVAAAEAVDVNGVGVDDGVLGGVGLPPCPDAVNNAISLSPNLCKLEFNLFFNLFFLNLIYFFNFVFNLIFSIYFSIYLLFLYFFSIIFFILNFF